MSCNLEVLMHFKIDYISILNLCLVYCFYLSLSLIKRSSSSSVGLQGQICCRLEPMLRCLNYAFSLSFIGQSVPGYIWRHLLLNCYQKWCPIQNHVPLILFSMASGDFLELNFILKSDYTHVHVAYDRIIGCMDFRLYPFSKY